MWADQMTSTFSPVSDFREADWDKWDSIEADQPEWCREWLEDEIQRLGTSDCGAPMFWTEEKRTVVPWGSDAAQLKYLDHPVPKLFSATFGYGLGCLADKMEKSIRLRILSNHHVFAQEEGEVADLV